MTATLLRSYLPSDVQFDFIAEDRIWFGFQAAVLVASVRKRFLRTHGPDRVRPCGLVVHSHSP